MAILLPVILFALGMLVVGARVALAGNRMSGVAADAARDASLARSPGAAEAAARTGATEALASAGLHCTDIQVLVDTSDFAALPGQPASIKVQVKCTVSMSDIGVRGLPGSRTLEDSAVSPLDPARDTS